MMQPYTVSASTSASHFKTEMHLSSHAATRRSATGSANRSSKKLALSLPDAELDQAIMDVCQKMKADRDKSRVAFYYLLAEKYGKLSTFASSPSAREQVDAMLSILETLGKLIGAN